MQKINYMIANLRLISPPPQQIMLINEDKDSLIPIEGEIRRHPEDDGHT